MSLIVGIFSEKKAVLDQVQFESIKDDLSFVKYDRIGLKSGMNYKFGILESFKTNESIYNDLPLLDENEQVTIVGDVRLDNRKELLSQLGLFQSKVSDSYLVLKLYLKYGDSSIAKLRGAFCTVIYDQRNGIKKLICFRDQLGVKPFHYALIDGSFYFASCKRSFKAVFGHVDERKRLFKINELYLKRVVGNLNQDPAATCYYHINRLLPAQLIIYKGGEVIKQTYYLWEKAKEIYFKNQEDYFDLFLKSLVLQLPNG